MQAFLTTGKNKCIFIGGNYLERQADEFFRKSLS